MRKLFQFRRHEVVEQHVIDFSRLTLAESLEELAGIHDDREFQQIASRLINSKAARPELISDQFQLLRHLISDERLTQADRQFATIAACHKAMEACDERSVTDLLPMISEVVETGMKMPIHPTKIRRCGRHIVFSAYSCQMHMELFLGSEAFFATARKAHHSWLNLPEKMPTAAFFQTCTNVARCLGMALVEPVMNGDDRLAGQISNELRAVFRLGLRSANPREVREDEFLNALRILHVADDVVWLKDRNEDALMLILRSCMRLHGADKVERITRNFQTLIVPRLSET